MARRGLNLGILKTDSTRGHMFQACGAVQVFLDQNPAHKNTIRNSSPVDPYKPTGALRTAWTAFLAGHDNDIGVDLISESNFVPVHPLPERIRQVLDLHSPTGSVR